MHCPGNIYFPCPLLPVWERPCPYISLPGRDLMMKEMGSRESRQCLWRSQVQPRPGQGEPGARDRQGCPGSVSAWAGMAGAGSAVFTAESPAPSTQQDLNQDF